MPKLCRGTKKFLWNLGHGGGLIIGAAERTSARSSSPGPLPLGRREGESSPVHLRREVHEEPRCFLTLIQTMNRADRISLSPGERVGVRGKSASEFTDRSHRNERFIERGQHLLSASPRVTYGCQGERRAGDRRALPFRFRGNKKNPAIAVYNSSFELI